MAYPVRTITRSQLLTGQRNGQLDPKILSSTPGQAGGATVTLIKPALRAWKALCAAAKPAGHILKATSVADSYRIYSIQERIFRQRYTTTYLPGRAYRMWDANGDGVKERWYQRPGTAVAAIPGTSNHGWAQAVDTGEERDSDLAAEPLDDPTLRWLIANEERFGWSHEIPSEPWHLHYFTGDRIPQAVLDYEASLQPHEEDDMGKALIAKKKGSADWWLWTPLVKRHLYGDPGRKEAAELVYIGQAEWDDPKRTGKGKPIVLPDQFIDRAHTIT